jgi:hypothetical protein
MPKRHLQAPHHAEKLVVSRRARYLSMNCVLSKCHGIRDGECYEAGSGGSCLPPILCLLAKASSIELATRLIDIVNCTQDESNRWVPGSQYGGLSGEYVGISQSEVTRLRQLRN